MKYVSYFINRASELAGIKPLSEENLNNNDTGSCLRILQDVVGELNGQDNIVFTYKYFDKPLMSNQMLFKKYNQSELDLIALSGTSAVDLTDRIPDFVPVVPPVVVAEGTTLMRVSYNDIVADQWGKDSWAFNSDYESATCEFSQAGMGRQLKIITAVPIEIPESPSDYLKVPDKFHEFIICKFALSIAETFGMTDTVPLLMGKLKGVMSSLINNNTSYRPTYTQVSASLSRFDC